MESIPVRFQKRSQFQVPPNILAMPIGPSKDLRGSISPEMTLPNPLILTYTVVNASLEPIPMDCARLYSSDFNFSNGLA